MDSTEAGNSNEGVDSKIARAYDEAVARAQVDPEDPDAERADVHGQLDVTEHAPRDNRVGEADPATDDATAEDEFGPGEELRSREFPVPPAMTGSGSRKLVIDQDTIADDESRRGGRAGTRMGDVQPRSDVPSIVDQDAVTPDLIQEQR